MSNRKPPERRTFSHDRYDILIKRQRSGKATFKELSELDEIVNRDPAIRERVLIENLLMQRENDTNGTDHPMDREAQPEPIKRQSVFQQIGAFFKKISTLNFSAIKHHFSFTSANNAVLL